MKYLNLIQDHDDISSVKPEGVNVIRCLNDDHVHYMTLDPRLMQPLTFEILTNGNIGWVAGHASLEIENLSIEYSKNGGEWVSLIPATNGLQIPVSSGDKVQFRGDRPNYQKNVGKISYKCNFNSNCDFKVVGNVMSLIDSTDFLKLKYFNLSTFGNFDGLFFDCTGLTDASKLLLPATTLTRNCYQSMFYGCTSLTTAPELPATTLAQSCYELMFNGCTNLSYIKCLATDISANYCTNYWVDGVASNGTFVKNASMTGWTTGANGIPSGWTVQDPEILK